MRNRFNRRVIDQLTVTGAIDDAEFSGRPCVDRKFVVAARPGKAMPTNLASGPVTTRLKTQTGAPATALPSAPTLPSSSASQSFKV
jgi:hypothetical protein